MRMPLVPTQVASCSTLLHTALRSPFRAVLVYFFSFGWNRLTGSPQGWPKKPRSVVDGSENLSESGVSVRVESQ